MNYVKKSNNQFYKKKLRKTNPSLYCFSKILPPCPYQQCFSKAY